MSAADIQERINERVRANNPGIVATGVTLEVWKDLEIPIEIRHEHGLDWNLFAEFAKEIYITVTPKYISPSHLLIDTK
jgi:hypothetical protein